MNTPISQWPLRIMRSLAWRAYHNLGLNQDAMRVQRLTDCLAEIGMAIADDAKLTDQARKLAGQLRLAPTYYRPLCEFAEALRSTGRMREYQKLVASTDFALFLAVHHPYAKDLSEFERETFFEVVDRCAQMAESITSTIRFVEYVVKNDIPGDFVECGVWRGATAYVIGKTLRHLNRFDRRIYLCDTFEGMPSGEPIDVHYQPERDFSRVMDEQAAFDPSQPRELTGSDVMRAALDEVTANVASSGYPMERFVFVKGLVEDTIPTQTPDRIAFLRLDTDHYRSTKHELEHLYPRLSRGGVLVIDDYGCFFGAKTATDDYLATLDVPVCLFRIDEHVRAAVKP